MKPETKNILIAIAITITAIGQLATFRPPTDTGISSSVLIVALAVHAWLNRKKLAAQWFIYALLFSGSSLVAARSGIHCLAGVVLIAFTLWLGHDRGYFTLVPKKEIENQETATE